MAFVLTSLIAGSLVHRVAADPGLSPGEAKTIREIAIVVDDPFPDGFDWSGLARAVIGLAPGQVLTREEMDRSVAMLSPLARVHTQIEKERVVFTLKPRKRVKSIDVQGSYPLFEQEVRDAMSTKPGAIFSPDTVFEEQSLVARRYHAEGYIDPQVRITWEQDADDGHYDLFVSIEKGPYYAIDQVRLKGNRAVSDALLKARMKTWRRSTFQAGLGRFREYRLRDDIKKLTAFYRRQGFADVAATYRLKKNSRHQRVSVEIEIYEGPLYKVILTGNQYFSSDVLKKDLSLFRLGNQGNSGIYRSIRKIRQRYLEAGFADVRVRRGDASQADTPGHRVVPIEIEEGRRLVLRSVSVRGARSLEAKTIRRQMLTHPATTLDKRVYVAQVLQDDLAAVQALYVRNGFLQALVEDRVDIDPKSKQVDVTVSIEEGVQTRVGQIVIKGELPGLAVDLNAKVQLTSGAHFSPHLVRAEENRLAAALAALGYPHVKVVGKVEISDDQTRADIAFDIVPGPLVHTGDIFFTGNFRTRTRLMARESALKSGAPFDLSKVLAAQRNMRDMNLFESVQVRTIGLKEKAGKVPMLVEVVEKKPYFFEIGGGFETAKGLFARTRIGDRNFQGANRQIWLGGEVSDIGHRVDAGMSVPRLFGTRIRTDLGLFAEREEEFNQDFGTDTYGGNLNLSRRMSRSVVTALGWRYENREQFLREQDASADVDPDALEPRRILVTTPTIWYDSRDSITRPRKGWYARLKMDISNGLDNDLDDFVRGQFDLRHFYLRHDRLTLAAMARVGYLVGDGDDARVPEDQLFFLGGTSDVRGYAENLLRFDADGDPVGGRLAMSANIEARYDIGRNMELITFADTGSLQLAAGDAEENDWRWSVGLGLGYITPIGPVSLFYGHKLDPRPDESNGEFHFSIGYTF